MATLLATLSALLWGGSDFGGGLASRRLPAVVVVGWSQVCALVVLVVAALATGAHATSTAWIGWGLAAGAVGATGLVVFYRALAIGTMGVVSPIAALGAIVPLAASVMSGDRLSVLQTVGVAAALLGAVAASGPELSGQASGRSVALAVISGALFGLTMVLITRGAAISPLLTATAMRFSSLILFGGAALFTRSLGGVTVRQIPYLAAVGAGDAAANVLFGVATTMGLSGVVAVLGSLYPVATVLLARLVLGERLRAVQIGGVSLALAGVALLSAH